MPFILGQTLRKDPISRLLRDDQYDLAHKLGFLEVLT